MIRSLTLLLTGNMANAILLLARNLLIARLISVHDYGIATTFSLVLAVIEMASTFGLQQMLVQHRRGDDPAFQAALQGFHLLRSVINAGLLFLLAGTFAGFMGVSEVTWAHQLLAVVLVLNGLVHMDFYRHSRDMRFGTMALANALSPLAALLVVMPLYWYYGDYRVMLWSLIVQAAATAVMSHLVADRPYRLRIDPSVIREGVRFGWPLLLDGVLLFILFNGEKLIVGREMGMAPLALFAIAITLTQTPALIMQKSASSFFLPQLSKAQGRFPELARMTITAHIVTAGLLVLGVMVCAAPFILLVLGDKYADALPLMTLLAVSQAIRLMKSAVATVSLAKGRTANSMIASLPRVLILLPAWYLAARNGDITLLIWIGIVGETLSLVVAFWLLRVQIGLGLRPLLPSLASCLALCALAGYWSVSPPAHSVFYAALPVLWLASMFLSRELSRYLRPGRRAGSKI